MSEKKEIAVIGDSNAAVGFRLAGLKRVFELENNISDRSLEELFTSLYRDSRIGIIVMTSNLITRVKHLTKSEERYPIVVEIPKLQAPRFPSAKEYYEKQTTGILGFGIEL